jgi:hypothetical protein
MVQSLGKAKYNFTKKPEYKIIRSEKNSQVKSKENEDVEKPLTANR